MSEEQAPDGTSAQQRKEQSRKAIALAISILLYLGALYGCLALLDVGSTVHSLSCNADASYCTKTYDDWYLAVFGGTGLALLLLLAAKQIRRLKWVISIFGIIVSTLTTSVSFVVDTPCGPGARCTTIIDHDYFRLIQEACFLICLGFPFLTLKRIQARLQPLRTKTSYLIFLLISLIASSTAVIVDMLTVGGTLTALGIVGALASICGLLQVKAPALKALLHLGPSEQLAPSAREAPIRSDPLLHPASAQTVTPPAPPTPALNPTDRVIPPAAPQTSVPPASPASLVSSGKTPTPATPPGSSVPLAHAVAPHQSPLPTERLGNYRLLRVLGQGGFASVYLAEHLSLGSLAAIKVLHTTLTQEDQEQFRQEGRLLAHLVHPHIIRILDFDAQGPLPFLVMEYAPGGTLRARHPKGSRVPLPLVAAYVQHVASSLDYAHSQKMIHRDIKPENLLLGRGQQVLLSDFGIAVLSHQSSSLSTQNVAGTASYMAPEHIGGKPRPSSDQYALAIVVYEWISGRRPFQGSFIHELRNEIVAELILIR